MGEAEEAHRLPPPLLTCTEALLRALRRPPSLSPWDGLTDLMQPAFEEKNQVQVIFSPEFLAASLQDHPECKERIFAVMDALHQLAEGGTMKLSYRSCERIDPRYLIAETASGRSLHSKQYVYTVQQISEQLSHSLLGGGLLRRLELRAGSFNASLRSVGALDAAMHLVMDDRVRVVLAPSRPPGHLATNRICIFDNIAVAALNAAMTYRGRDGQPLRVLIFDVDAHHGLHLQQAFYDVPNICYASIHLDSVHPGEGFPEQCGRQARHVPSGLPTAELNGIGATLNLPMRGRGLERTIAESTESYLARFYQVALPWVARFKPELTFIAGGVDGIDSDPFTDMGLSARCFEEVAATLSALTDRGIIISLEGGYDVYGGLPDGYTTLARGAVSPRLPAIQKAGIGPWAATPCDVVAPGREVQAMPVLDVTRCLRDIPLVYEGELSDVLEARCSQSGLNTVQCFESFYGLGAGCTHRRPEIAIKSLGELIAIGGRIACLSPEDGPPRVTVAEECYTPFITGWEGEPQILFRPQISGDMLLLDLLETLDRSTDYAVPLLGVTGFLRLKASDLVEKHLVRSPSLEQRPEAAKSDPVAEAPLALSNRFYSEYFQSYPSNMLGDVEEVVVAIVGIIARRGGDVWTDSEEETRVCARIAYESPIDTSRPQGRIRTVSAHVHFALVEDAGGVFEGTDELKDFVARLEAVLAQPPRLISHIEVSSRVRDAVLGVTPIVSTAGNRSY